MHTCQRAGVVHVCNVLQAMIANTVHRNGMDGLADVLFPTEGEKLAGNETSSAPGLLSS